tara:strand:- start:1550 stop:2296 length:747 start_codon:yes stop_codon:yes gene_type:complete
MYLNKIFEYILSIIYYFFFFQLLLIFQPIQWLCYNLFGYNAHKKSVDILNFFLLGSLKILGTRISFKYESKIPKNFPLIFVSNHQSTYDVSPIIWNLREFHPKFVSKKELGKGIPSISYNLKKGGSVLIDRNGEKGVLDQIKKFGENIEKNKWSAVIFPEGTRSKDGNMKKFHHGGLNTLIHSIPSAYIIPLSINNSWKFGRKNYFPLPLGVEIKFFINKPIKIDQTNSKNIIDEIEKRIKKNIIKIN